MNTHIKIEEHYEGRRDCPSCWHKPYQCKCGGLIHNEFFDYDGPPDYDLILIYLCDRCGEDYEYISEFNQEDDVK